MVAEDRKRQGNITGRPVAENLNLSILDRLAGLLGFQSPALLGRQAQIMIDRLKINPPKPGLNVQQLSVFVENKAGRLSEVSEVLGAAGVNIRGFSVSDTEGFGIVRLVVDNPQRGLQALSDAGFTVKVSDVICLDLPDQPGGLASVLKRVSVAGVNIEYIYSLIATYVVINVADIDRALSLLESQPVALVSQEEIARI